MVIRGDQLGYLAGWSVLRAIEVIDDRYRKGGWTFSVFGEHALASGRALCRQKVASH
jgi:hypothetical protein